MRSPALNISGPPNISSSGISPLFSGLFLSQRQITHVLRTLAPLRFTCIATFKPAFDLHVLSTPPAFVLSQNQTLRIESLVEYLSTSIIFFSSLKSGTASALPILEGSFLTIAQFNFQGTSLPYLVTLSSRIPLKYLSAFTERQTHPARPSLLKKAKSSPIHYLLWNLSTVSAAAYTGRAEAQRPKIYSFLPLLSTYFFYPLPPLFLIPLPFSLL